MTPDQLNALKDKEYGIYKREVGSAIERKLRLLYAHLYIEHLLERYISTKLKTTDGLFGQRGLTFEKKICLAKSFGELSSQRLDSVRKLNQLRNNLVHRFAHQITEEEVDDFGTTLGRFYTEMKGHPAKLQRSLLDRCCDRLCGEMCYIVVNAENASNRAVSAK